jgi:hypothetical protein
MPWLPDCGSTCLRRAISSPNCRVMLMSDDKACGWYAGGATASPIIGVTKSQTYFKQMIVLEKIDQVK